MKLTKKTEAEIWQVYDAWLHSYLNGDVSTYGKYLDKDYHFIGSTNNEEFLSKKDTTQFFADTADQLAGKCDLRNETKIIEKFEGLVFVTHLFDAWFLNENDWAYYGRFRFTNTLKENKEGWRFVYQHFSTTDSKTDEGETIGFDKVNAENIELKNAIKRRTFELEQKNRELEIETSLERIRAQAVAMKESTDLLDIVVTMRNEFIKLGHEAHYFWHMMWLPETYEKAMTSGDGSKIGFVMTLPRHIHGDIPLIANWEKSKKSTIVYSFTTEESIDYVDKMVALGDFKNIDPQAPSHEDLKHIGGLTFIMARTTHGEIGYSLPGIVKNPPKDDIDILVKFAGAFDLAHQRFLDLQKAEKQARETQIELALEKVRSRTMAMQHSDELQEASFLLDQQVRALGIKTWGCAFNIYRDKDSTEWFGNEAGVLPTYTVPRKGIFKEYYQKGQQGESFFIKEFSGDKCVAHYEYMSSLPVIGDVLKNLKKTNNGFPTYQLDHVAYFKYGYLLFITKEHVPDAHDIFKRFAKVFEQTYTRFLDLQKAEKQAREAQIEVAMERIRSRSLAMHTSEELMDVITELRRQIDDLGQLDLEASVIHLYTDGEPMFESIAAVRPPGESGEIVLANVFFPVDATNQIKHMLKMYVSDATEYTIEFEKEMAEEWQKTMMKYAPTIAERRIGFVKNRRISEHSEYWNFADFSDGSLLLVTHSPASEDTKEVLRKAAQVFDLAYRRYKDLKKAEAQAREAQIEVALERVRSRSMAMHDSNELKEVIQVLYDQFIHLGINVEHAGFIIDYKENDDMHIWLADKNAIFPKIVLPYFDCAHWNSFNNAKKRGLNFFANQLDFEEKNKFYKDLFVFIPDLPEETKATYFGFDGLAISTMLSDNVGLYIENYAGIPFSEAENKILMRFGKVFQQTYTRFLDLQKAEAQTREAQIEGALERVRARAMSMHHTDELTDVLCVLFDQFDLLGINPVLTHLTLFDLENEIFSLRITTSAKNRIVADQLIDVNAVDAWKNSYENWKKSDPNAIDCIDYANEDLPMVWELLNEVMNALPESHKISPKDFPNGLYTTQGHFKFGYIGFNHRRHSTDEEKSIVVRFAKEFGRAYQRFLDLQKAEAQAKEAQIEAALERVRSYSMGMQSTDDFGAVTTEMFNQLRNLGEDLFATGIVFCDKHEGHVEQWHSIPNGGMLSPFIVPIDLDYIHQYRYDQWKKGEELFSIEIPSDFIEQHFKDIFNLPSAQVALKDLESRNAPMPAAPPWEIDYGASFKNGYILASSLQHFENIDILPRFANVFEQAYTRFLDLQKAESQAREAQIEASLERVRSASMAMHKTEDLSEVVVVYFDQLKKLNIEFVQSWISIFQVEEGYVDVWFSPLEGIYKDPKHFKMPSALFEDTSIKSWKDGLPFSYISLTSKEEIDQFMKICDEVTDSDYFMISQKQLKLDQLEFLDANNKYGCISKSNIVKATKEEEEILQRFSKVFEQTYTRFLDLQKAEAQAREAQIEAALERVRAQSNAMHKSEDLANVVTTLYEELRLLNSKILRCGIGIINEKSRNVNTWITSDLSSGTSIELSGDEPLSGHPLLDSIFDYWMKQKNLSYLLEGKDLIEYYKTVIKTDFQKHFANEGLDNANVKQYYHCTMFPAGGLYVFESSPITKEQIIVLQRFTDAFNRAYTRHQDLQKAEAQAKEAQIEMALEKVRSRTMAMQNSNELPEAANNLFLQVQELGIPAWSAGYCIWENEDKKSASCNMSSEGEIQKGFSLPTIGEGYNFYDPYKKGEPFHVAELGGKKLVKHYDFMKTLPIVGEVLEDFAKKGIMLPTFQIFHIVYFSHGYLMFITYEPVPDDWDIFKRFGKVFQQTYTRFLDLQKAEAQAREAQINLAVERVRAKALAMHKSEEIIEVVAKLKDEVMGLDIQDVVAATIFLNEGEDKVRMWDLSSLEDDDNYSEVPFDVTFKIKKTDPHLYVKRVWENPEHFFVEIQDEKDFKRLMQWLRELHKNEIADEVEDFIKKTQLKRLYHSAKKLNNGKLVIDQLNAPSNEMETILTKMGAAFDLAYKRFEDLQKAEAQAKEAQIETALEKVRSRSMAMHNSNELLEVITVVSTQLTELGIRFSHASFGYYDNDDTFNFWTSARGKTEDLRLTVPYADLVIFNNIKEAQKQKLTFFSDLVSNADHIKWHKHLLKHVDANLFSEEENAYIMSKGVARSIAINPNIMLILANQASIPYSDEENKIIERFGLVFEQSYTRFLDLKRAEAQARESQIETALEKVRSRSLAMHQSEELWDVINEMFLQFEVLKIEIDSCFINIYQDENPKDLTFYVAAGGQTYQGAIFIPYGDFTIFNRLVEARKKKENFFSIIMNKEDTRRWWTYFLSKVSNIKIPTQRKNYLMKSTGLAQSVVLGEYASIHMMKYVDIPYLEEENQILKRFGKAFDQVYTRFLDLQKAEAQAREAQIEASLERVRSRTLAMQTSEELAETSVIVFKQLLELGIAPNRLFIGIVKSDNDTIEAWTTNEDGSKLAVHFTPQASKNKSIKKMLDGWKQQKKSLIIDMKGKELQAYFKYLNEDMKIPFIDGLKQKRRVQTIAYFSGGLIGMAAPEEQPNDTTHLLERFAAVFNLTYTRFKDLKIAEANAEKAEQDLIKLQAAKKSAEEALSELQLTQNQLIQSEKMASLGELTAGIAHEIQNPLNFVNNFSEVSKELLDEMIEELENGDMEEVKAITDDVIQNLEKINHHGKRADSIVKGMLQHSRATGDKKEPTNINALADEYLRLAYHGLRAKDKSFNATLVTDFDDSIGNVNMLPQDIGRVVLNLLTNAFYVVNEKKQNNKSDYEPTVSISTKKKGNWVSISVKDNGNGIPKKVLDKIFQPFFTTKPTGQGTGLGLSMSYDIVTKGHGGELKVETKDGKGTEFSIRLPL